MTGVEPPPWAPSWVSQGRLTSRSRFSESFDMAMVLLCFRRELTAPSLGLLPVTRDSLSLHQLSLQECWLGQGFLMFHKKDACLPPVVLASRVKRECLSGVKSSVRTQTQSPPRSVTLHSRGGGCILGCILWAPWFCLSRCHACFHSKEY